MQVNQEKTVQKQDDDSLMRLLWVLGYRIAMALTVAGGICWLGIVPIRAASGEFAWVMITYIAALIIMQGVYRAFDVGMARVSELVISQGLACIVSAAMIYLGVALYTHELFNPLPLMAVLMLQLLLSCGWSIAVNYVYFRKHSQLPTVVICRSEELISKLRQTPYFEKKFKVCKMIRELDDDMAAVRRELDGCEVVFTLGAPASYTNGIAKLCLEMGIKGYFMPHLGHIIMAGAEYMAMFSVPILQVQRAGGHSEYRALKRLFDVLAALAGIIIASPIMAVTALAIRLEDHGPVFYRQVRLTKNGKKFNILKFRSMSVNAERDGVARLAGANDSRITKVGRFIRACRIDELPQLINILAGDMSFVGPRPERPEIAAQYQQELPEFALRLQVKAGLTGLAQVYGRYNTEPYNKLQMDLMYIKEMSFLKDLQLILATVKILFARESTQGVANGQATAMGNPAREKHHRSA